MATTQVGTDRTTGQHKIGCITRNPRAPRFDDEECRERMADTIEADLRTVSKNIFKSQFEQMLLFVHNSLPVTVLHFSGRRPSVPDTSAKV